jgi:hypothetical protein
VIPMKVEMIGQLAELMSRVSAALPSKSELDISRPPISGRVTGGGRLTENGKLRLAG